MTLFTRYRREMSNLEEKLNGNAKAEDMQELDDDNLEEVSGGKMRDNIVKNNTTDISNDTKENV